MDGVFMTTQERSREIVEGLLAKARIKINGTGDADVQVHNPELFHRVLQQGSLGLGESYMAGWWDCKRLDIFFELLLRHKIDEQAPKNIHDLAHIAIARVANLQSKKRAPIVGRKHYDLGNDLFFRMLDSHMQYSCGYWKNATNLEEAQQAKLRLICDKLHLTADMRVLDIGCGWGGLAYYMAKNYGVSVVGVTISAEQQKMAQDRCAGLPVDIRLQDYRDLDEQFDRIVSVGMFEHVGPKNYNTYFKVVDTNLKENGLFLLHTIGAKRTGHNVDPWIDRYIFPNGCLPSVKQISAASESHFIMEDWHNFGADYDTTLMAWYERFNASWDEISSNYTPTFRRMFNYYLLCCAGAFRARDIQLWQVMFSRGKKGGLQVAR
ncbi:TPA: cyclopropane fatty acyl phospholipid synthase [Escherichia coli]|nr:cyclopropane fatty acyl phospholipid synthase [Escherichia coli]